ncbi:unnamed protein product [Camellia sinensis]
MQGDKVFSDLGIAGAVKGKTYLLAFLICWLCKFVLPHGNGDLIRPGVFKVTSMMARGRSFSLEIPVLASIYKGLNKIVSSSDPGKCDAIFPIHYVYAWLAEYFNTHFSIESALKPQMMRYAGERMAKHFEESEAYDLFRSCKDMTLHHLAYSEGNPKELVDDGHLSNSDLEYFISIHSSYLSLRSSSAMVIEPYSSHRFNRQFGFIPALGFLCF